MAKTNAIKQKNKDPQKNGITEQKTKNAKIIDQILLQGDQQMEQELKIVKAYLSKIGETNLKKLLKAGKTTTKRSEKTNLKKETKEKSTTSKKSKKKIPSPKLLAAAKQTALLLQAPVAPTSNSVAAVNKQLIKGGTSAMRTDIFNHNTPIISTNNRPSSNGNTTQLSSIWHSLQKELSDDPYSTGANPNIKEIGFHSVLKSNNFRLVSDLNDFGYQFFYNEEGKLIQMSDIVKLNVTDIRCKWVPIIESVACKWQEDGAEETVEFVAVKESPSSIVLEELFYHPASPVDEKPIIANNLINKTSYASSNGKSVNDVTNSYLDETVIFKPEIQINSTPTSKRNRSSKQPNYNNNCNYSPMPSDYDRFSNPVQCSTPAPTQNPSFKYDVNSPSSNYTQPPSVSSFSSYDEPTMQQQEQLSIVEQQTNQNTSYEGFSNDIKQISSSAAIHNRRQGNLESNRVPVRFSGQGGQFHPNGGPNNNRHGYGNNYPANTANNYGPMPTIIHNYMYNNN